jgi:hypothetical protein
MASEVEVRIDYDEVQEACAVIRRWAGRLHLLPEAIRRELDAAATDPDAVVVRDMGATIVTELAPRYRALIANLRVQERRGV